ncbi:MAG: endonuclease/exonuclease/phosphatase family protein [Candidatus Omnitrophica bacterium]|nr:endonuclease/exonuclease/phosphatase family protein [Candidatus Omnitrophota bacterium]
MRIRNMSLFVIYILALSGCSVKNYLFNYTKTDRPRYAQLATLKPPTEIKKTIKVVSYNIKFSKKITQAIKLLESEPNLKDADILLLQEMDEVGVKRIAKELKYNYVYYPAVLHQHNDKDFGNAILSKWKMSDDEKIILPHFKLNQKQRIAVGATVYVNDKKIRVFCVHLGVFVKPSDRKQRIDLVVKNIPEDIKYAIVGGDFNSFTKKDRAEINTAFKKYDFQESTANLGWTFALGRKTQLDHIYTKGFNTVAKGKVINLRPSDHLPVWTEVKF